jgi:hypothetical protein
VATTKAEQQPREVERRNKTFRKWKGVNTQSARVSIPEECFYDLENLIPIGEANLHTIPNISGVLASYGSDTIYWMQFETLNYIDYMFLFSTTGKVFQYAIVSGVSTWINPASTFSGAGSRMDQWKNSAVLFVDSTGYYSWDGTSFVLISGIGVPSSGTDIAVYQGRVWIAQGRVITLSGPDDYTAPSFQPINGAATVNLTDPQLRGAVTRMVSANGYLYIAGRSSWNIISDVYIPTNATTGVSAAPPTPVFTNTNIQANVGCDQPASIFMYGRDVLFANRYGAQVMGGVDVQRLSQDIDGTWQYIDFSQSISGGCAVVQNILNACFLIKRGPSPDEQDDPTDLDLDDGVGLACFFNNKWWFASYGALTFIAQGMVNNAPALFGILNNNLYQLFSDMTTAPASQWATPLWAMEDSLADKQVIRAGFEAVISSFTGTFTATIDTPNSEKQFTSTSNIGAVQWINTGSSIVTWQNTAQIGTPNTTNWYSGAYLLYSSDTPGAFAKYVGISGYSSGAIYQLSSVFLDYKLRARY